MKKKILVMTALVVVSIGAIIGVSFLDITSTGEVYYKELSIVANLTESGNLVITEKWNIRYETESSNAYREFDFTGYKCNLTDISVYDEDNGKALKYNENFHYSSSSSIKSSDYGTFYFDTSTNENGGEFGIIIYPESYVNRHFTVKYTIENAAVLYDDVADLYWKILGEDFEAYIGDFSLIINLPNEANYSSEECLAFFHCENQYAQYSFEGNSVRYSAKKIAAGTMLEPRVLLPTKAFDAAQIIDIREGACLESIMEIEQNNIDEWNNYLDKKEMLFIIDIVACVLIYVFAVGSVVEINLLNKRIKGDYPEFVREIPEGWTAGEMGLPFYYYDGGIEDGKNRGRVLSATILELARREYIELIPTEKDYAIGVKSDVPNSKLADLKPHERTLRNIFVGVQNTIGHPFTMDEFEEYSKSHYQTINNDIKSFMHKVSSRFNDGGYRGKSTTLTKAMPVIGIVMTILSAIIFVALDAFVFSGVALVTGGILLIIGKPQIVKLNDKGEALYQQIHGLERYMKEFSNLKDYAVPQLVLWEEYLVYATMMGISEEVVKQLKLVYPELTEASNSLDYTPYRNHSYLFTYVWISGAMGRRGASPAMFDIGAGMGRSLSRINDTIVRMAQPRSVGTGGKGGSFGHGGGFGRGGGGTGGGGGGFGGGGGGFR